jgi:hypothetical protein
VTVFAIYFALVLPAISQNQCEEGKRDYAVLEELRSRLAQCEVSSEAAEHRIDEEKKKEAEHQIQEED